MDIIQVSSLEHFSYIWSQIAKQQCLAKIQFQMLQRVPAQVYSKALFHDSAKSPWPGLPLLSIHIEYNRRGISSLHIVLYVQSMSSTEILV